jgi:hypothetical protein
MAKKQITYPEWLRVSSLRITRIHFLLVLAIVAQIILFDAGKLITSQIVLYRSLDLGLLLIATSVVWVLAHNRDKDANFYKLIINILIGADILFAAHSVYLQRGMASRAVCLFAIPIIVSAVMLNRAAIYTTALVSIAVYFATTMAYFVLNFNEGYRLELYGEVGFYSAIFLILAGLLSVFIKFKDE